MNVTNFLSSSALFVAIIAAAPGSFAGEEQGPMYSDPVSAEFEVAMTTQNLNALLGAASRCAGLATQQLYDLDWSQHRKQAEVLRDVERKFVIFTTRLIAETMGEKDDPQIAAAGYVAENASFYRLMQKGMNQNSRGAAAQMLIDDLQTCITVAGTFKS